MGTARQPAPTVAFVDGYCAAYRDLFADVRSFEHLSLLDIGLISDLPRKSLPAIGRRIGVDAQALHHCFANADWSLEQLRTTRLELTKQALRDRSFVRCIDETGDLKQGKSTDYVARQDIGSMGAVDRGVVSVSAYGVLDTVTFPLRFQVFKPESQLKPEDTYPSKPTIAIDLVKQIVADGTDETRSIREIVFGKRHRVRSYERTSDPEQLPAATTRFVMTNLEGDLRHRLGNHYGLRTWIEYGYKHLKYERGIPSSAGSAP